VIPHSKGEYFENKVKEAIQNTWKEISEGVKDTLKKKGVGLNVSLWNTQIDNAVSVYTAYLKVPNLDGYAQIKDEIPEDLEDKQSKWLEYVERGREGINFGHFYALSYEILGAVLTQRTRLFEQYEESGKKCIMCGIRRALALGKDLLEKEFSPKEFREKERLCAVCMVKRLYRRVLTGGNFSLKLEKKLKVPSVAEIASKDFIELIKLDSTLKDILEEDEELVYEEQWTLSEKEKTIKEIENKTGKNREELIKKLKEYYKNYFKPNKYYAILMMDGDHMGKMLSGDKLPAFGDFLHPVFKNCIKDTNIKGIIDTKRILSPSVHIAISRALKDFSVIKVGGITEKYDGFLVYSGGDDVLALLPTDKVLEAANEIRNTFSKDFYKIEGKKVMGLGKNASISAGIVFSHYKYPLYDALETAREGEKEAKDRYGRNAFAMNFIKHSGEIMTSGGKWDFVEDLNFVANAIVEDKISHRFIYDLLEAVKILSGEMLSAEIKRLLNRRKSENASNELIAELHGRIMCLAERYEANGLEVTELANALKINHDALRGDAR